MSCFCWPWLLVTYFFSLPTTQHMRYKNVIKFCLYSYMSRVDDRVSDVSLQLKSKLIFIACLWFAFQDSRQFWVFFVNLSVIQTLSVWRYCFVKYKQKVLNNLCSSSIYSIHIKNYLNINIPTWQVLLKLIVHLAFYPFSLKPEWRWVSKNYKFLLLIFF